MSERTPFGETTCVSGISTSGTGRRPYDVASMFFVIGLLLSFVGQVVPLPPAYAPLKGPMIPRMCVVWAVSSGLSLAW